MRAHYYVWKNLLNGMDYVGFHHYRRALVFYFLMEPNATSEVALMCADALKHRGELGKTVQLADYIRYLEWIRTWDNKDFSLFKEWVSHFDLIVPRPWVIGGSLGSQYGQAHSAEHWQKLVKVLGDHAWFEQVRAHLDLELPYLVPCNMFIMRSSLFREYMSFWYEVIEKVERMIKPSEDLYQNRVVAFLSERLFTVYLHHLRIQKPTLRIAELPYLFSISFSI
jgi:hypothetical protein